MHVYYTMYSTWYIYRYNIDHIWHTLYIYTCSILHMHVYYIMHSTWYIDGYNVQN